MIDCGCELLSRFQIPESDFVDKITFAGAVREGRVGSPIWRRWARPEIEMITWNMFEKDILRLKMFEKDILSQSPQSQFKVYQLPLHFDPNITLLVCGFNEWIRSPFIESRDSRLPSSSSIIFSPTRLVVSFPQRRQVILCSSWRTISWLR